MTIYAVYVINKAGGLIYQWDGGALPPQPTEKTFSWPLDLVLKVHDDKVAVDFGQRDDVRVGHYVLAVNGVPAAGCQLEDGRDILELLAAQANYPVAIKFGRMKLTTNEKIVLAGMFHSLYAIASQLSPEEGSTGIQELLADTFKLNCIQTLTGVKFFTVSDPRQTGQDALLKRVYEIYSDFALKNPFYSLEMPIRCELFDQALAAAVEQAERPQS